LTIDFAKAMNIGKKGMIALGAAAVGMGAGLAVGLNKVIQLGSDLDHMASQSGATVKELMVLRQVFEDNGVSSDNARLALNKMQKLMFEAGRGSKAAKQSLSDLGLTLEDMAGKTTGEQFRLIGQKITEIEDPTKRAGVAMAVFGRSGAELLSVFGGSKIDDAAKSIGAQADLLDKNSVLFERVGTLLGRTGTKLQGFFVGIADKVVPLILPLLERLDGLDLAGQGERFGNALSAGLRGVIGLFQSGNLLAVIRDTFLIAGADFLNQIATGWINIFVWMGTAFKEVMGSVITFVSSGFMAIAQTFGGFIVGMLAEAVDMIPGLSKQAKELAGVSDSLKNSAQKSSEKSLTAFSGMGERIADGFVKNMEATGANDFKLFDTSALKAGRAQMIESAMAAVPTIPEAAAVLLKKPKVQTALMGDEDMEAPDKAGSGGVSSLAAIGGGGGVAMSGIESLVDVSKEGNSILKAIEKGILGVKDFIQNMKGGWAFALQ